MRQTILIADDEPMQLELIRHVISNTLGYRAVACAAGQEAVDYVLSGQDPKPDLLLLDLMMPGMSGIDVIRALRPQRPHLPMIVLTIYGDLEKAVAAIKAGATDFLAKPAEPQRLDVSIQNALRINHLSGEVRRLQRAAEGQTQFSDLIGSGPAMRRAIKEGQRAAASDIPVLIQGESGTGKELFARAIHGCSARARKPFVALNCGAIPGELAESILFGHERGAFTGASSRSIGKFREADGGTLFLDEIGELKPDLQVKLLRVLQENEVQPVGGRQPEKVDVRLISATNRNLAQAAQAGEFREDLFYRLNVFPVTLPALKDRREDIPELAEHFFRRFCAVENKPVQDMSAEVLEFLRNCRWPGNVRQLENAMFRAVVMCDRDRLTPGDFHGFVQSSSAAAGGNGHSNGQGNGDGAALHGRGGIDLLDGEGNVRNFSELEADIIKFALRHYSGHMSEVARKLGIGRSTLYRKINEMGIEVTRAA